MEVQLKEEVEVPVRVEVKPMLAATRATDYCNPSENSKHTNDGAWRED